MQRNATSDTLSTSDILRVTGFFTIAMSAVAGLVAFFVIPSGYMASFTLAFAMLFFLAGLIALGASAVLSRRERRSGG
jgi:pilus assembly protein TadC